MGSSGEKTTMIILCDDGSLKIYVADPAKTEYWLQPHLKQTNPILQLKSHVKASTTNPSQWSPAMHLFNLLPTTIQEMQNSRVLAELANATKLAQSESKATTEVTGQKPPKEKSEEPRLTRKNAIKKKKSSASTQPNSNSNQAAASTSTITPSSMFDIDYFEKCAQINDYELGGRDLLEVYNAQQLKSRLNLGNTRSVLSNRPDGFSLEISYTSASASANMLLIGCRVHLGTASLERVPAYFEVFGRRIPVTKPVRPRWYDVCLTREEAFIGDNKLTLKVGPSQDSRGSRVVSIDALLVYAKSRDELGWSRNEANQLQSAYNDKQKQRNGKPSSSEPQENKASTKKLIKKKTDVKRKQPDPTAIETIQLEAYEPKFFDKLLGQSLHLAEHCLLLSENISDANDNEPHTISKKIMALICPPLVLHKAKSLLFNSLALSSSSLNNTNLNALLASILPLYNAYKDEALLTLVLRTFKINVPKSVKLPLEYFDQIYDYEQLQRVLLICGSLIHEQRAHNMARFAADNKTFVIALNSLFWRCVNRCSQSPILSIGECQQTNLTACVETLIECMHSLLLVEVSVGGTQAQLASYFGNLPLVNLIIGCYMKLICSTHLHINFTSRKTLLHLLKHHHQSNLLPQPQPHPIQDASKKSIFSPSTLNNAAKSSSAAKPASRSSKATPTLQNQASSASRSVDEAVNFSGLSSNAGNNTYEDLDLRPDGESDILVGYDGQAVNLIEDSEPPSNALEENVTEFTPAAISAAIAAVVAPSASNHPESANAAQPQQQFMSLAPFSVDQEDEMLQLAMALSLNEANAAAANSANPPPPPVFPRQTLPASSNTSNSKPNVASSTTPKSNTQTTKKEQEVLLPIVQAVPSYLQNTNAKLALMRKVMLEKMAHCIESAYFERSFVVPKNLSESHVATAGLSSIAFFQCVLTLMADLNSKDANDRMLLDSILHGILGMLQPLKDLSYELKANK